MICQNCEEKKAEYKCYDCGTLFCEDCADCMEMQCDCIECQNIIKI
jgi:hypothetical protein